MKVLVVSPHPDDDLIGCGGSMAKHLSEGDSVYVIYVTNGDADNQEYSPEDFTKLRKEGTLRAAEVMGLNPSFLTFLDQPVWNIDQNKTRKQLLALVRKIQPDICYIPPADNHVDHRLVHQLCLDAGVSSSRWFKAYGIEENSWEVPVILVYEVWTPNERPSFVTNVNDFMEKKKSALYEHESQNTIKKLLAIATFRLVMIGKGLFCKCFQVIKTTKPF